MRASLWLAPFALILAFPVAESQHAGGSGGSSLAVAPKEATQFDFLLGQWELDVKPKAVGLAQRIHGVPKLQGTWKATRAFEGWGIEDELRIADQGGTLRAYTKSMRVYDPATLRWNATSLDVFRSHITTGTAEFKDGSMTALSDGRDTDGKAYRGRVRYLDITASSFKYQQDRSYDGGKTWDDVTLTITARRVADPSR